MRGTGFHGILWERTKRSWSPFLRLSLVLLLALALCGAARAEEVSYLSPAPGSCWAVTNEGDNDAAVYLNNLDYVVTDPECYVTDRDVTAEYPSNHPVIPAGGTVLLQNSGAFSGVVTGLPGLSP